ncbi:UDP-N-acetylmuramoyl-L-alanine--D-glutamate ligase [Niveibacterium sp. 24ML]|uniref:UDP-N-acetylmuramoyl-L-alanine--D-glutamate ligase n=1 Tax=Niveibacterium sp. 24ML TaxID=2985512 RepID=UPI00226D6631|nr:UDP-N-acetylmuramoyl-L-alanine--D-glutamate ligase [Niveibacterium sp. 24ML]MCX9157861.1 UDP-N-acetylmuramoyl-L-alanine--D-glutamate ligase [Niveibacterium sp. 24ML]
MELKGLRVLVLGLGESGLAMVRHLSRQGAVVRVADTRAAPPGVDALATMPQVELRRGTFEESLLDAIELLAISPGIDPRQRLLEAAAERAIPVVGEFDLFAWALRASGQTPRIIAITGTNGKTTTTALTGALCQGAGLDTAVAGNISPAVLDEWMRREDAATPADAWVLELSSFQLETCHDFAPDAATVLNVTDDHLDRYAGLDDYAAAKARVFSCCAVQVINRDDARVRQMQRSDRDAVSFGLGAPDHADAWGVLAHDGQDWLALGEQRLLPRTELNLAGAHNVANALAALALGHAIGLPVPAMLDALRAFRGLPHRVELIARRADGVAFYDDSKGTNVAATVAALEGLGLRVALIAGGDGKGQDFTPLREAFARHARAVVLIGRDAGAIAAAVEGCGVPLLRADSLPAAVLLANEQAREGDAVMLSPACASLDMFRNYAHRAEVFCDAVWALPGVARR